MFENLTHIWLLIFLFTEYNTKIGLGKVGVGVRLCKFIIHWIQHLGCVCCRFDILEDLIVLFIIIDAVNIAGANINPDLLLYVFLPALIFEGSFAMDYHQIKVHFLSDNLIKLSILVTRLWLLKLTLCTWVSTLVCCCCSDGGVCMTFLYLNFPRYGWRGLGCFCCCCLGAYETSYMILRGTSILNSKSVSTSGFQTSWMIEENKNIRYVV